MTTFKNSKESFGVSLIFLIQKVKLSCCSIFNELWWFCFLLSPSLDLFCGSCRSLSVGLFIISQSLVFVKRFFKSFFSFFEVFSKFVFCSIFVVFIPWFSPRGLPLRLLLFQTAFRVIRLPSGSSVSLSDSFVIISYHVPLVNPIFEFICAFFPLWMIQQHMPWNYAFLQTWLPVHIDLFLYLSWKKRNKFPDSPLQISFLTLLYT